MKIKLHIELDELLNDDGFYMFYFVIGCNQFRMYESWDDRYDSLPNMTKRFKKLYPNEN